jgi:hypothetical protein
MNMRFDLKYWLKRAAVVAAFFAVFNLLAAVSQAGEGVPPTPVPATADVDIQSTSIRYLEDLEFLVFEQEVLGRAGGTPPQARGQLDGAPVLAHVFVTDLDPATVGFGSVEGTLALAITAHPDFDDTPLWDENVDGNYENDGIVFHSHWVVLVADERIAGGLSVRQFIEGDESVVLPPTNPGMAIYMDSPGYQVNLRGHRLQVLVPAYRLRHKTDFSFDAVTAYLQVNTSDNNRPMLGVYKVYEILSGDLSLPYRVGKE